jgi:hypothetical protein
MRKILFIGITVVAGIAIIGKSTQIDPRSPNQSDPGLPF